MVWSCSVVAQINRYVVHFTDKNNSPYSVGNPSAYLSQKALDRRSRLGISISDNDLPVNPNYKSGVKNTGASIYFSSKWLNVLLIEADAGLIPQIEALPFVSKVEYVAPGTKLNGRFENNVKESQNKNYQSGVKATDFQLNLLGVDEMHADGYYGKGIEIAVLDAGFYNVQNLPQFNHLYSSNQLMYTYDYTTNQGNVYNFSDHGTKVLSTLAASDPEFEGTVPEASYMLFLTEDVFSEYRIEEYNWVFAAEFADSAGVDIITTSLGYSTFDDPSMNYQYSDMDGKTSVVSQGASAAAATGILVFVAAGNEGDKSWQYIVAPADVENVMTVGSVLGSGTISSFSSKGPTPDGRIKPDVVALGSGVSLINSAGFIVSNSGTSFATPQVAGLAAGLWQAFPQLTPEQMRDYLRQSASQASNPDDIYGYGQPNYLVFENLALGENLTNYFNAYPNPVFSDDITISSTNLLHDQNVDVTVLDPQGKVLLEKSLRLTLIYNSATLDTSGLSEGLYIMVLRSPDRVESFRIVKSL